MAQIISAIQMVYEQKYIAKYDVPPLLVVGCEGFFGMTILSSLLIPFYFIKVPSSFQSPNDRLEDALDAFRQISVNPFIALALTGTILSIAFFNFAGISITKEMNATTRMVLDSVRTLVIWIVSLSLQWQNFNYLQQGQMPCRYRYTVLYSHIMQLARWQATNMSTAVLCRIKFASMDSDRQVIGFTLLISGMCVYNDILFGPTNASKLAARFPSTFGRGCCAWYYLTPTIHSELVPSEGGGGSPRMAGSPMPGDGSSGSEHRNSNSARGPRLVVDGVEGSEVIPPSSNMRDPADV